MKRLPAAALGLLAILILVFAAACTSAAPAARPVSGDVGTDSSSDGEDPADPDSGEPGGNQAPQAPDGTLVVYTGTLYLEVTDLRGTVDRATALIGGLGGNVAASHEQNTDGHHSASITFRIPAARWSEAVAGLRGLGEVQSEDTDAKDVTAEVVDLEARLANLRATEAAFQGIMTRATTIADVLKVQAELTKVRGDIESLTAQRDHLADQAAMGTLEVQFNMPVAAADVASQGWDLGKEIDSAVAALVRISQGLASLGIWVAVVFLPVAIPVVLIGYIAVRLRRRYLARHAAQTPATPSA